MQQILVIRNVDLWVSLNRRFAGSEAVCITQSPTWDAGLQAARTESPDLIICAAENATGSPARLSRLFEQAGIDPARVICIHQRGGEDSVGADTSDSEVGITFCTADEVEDVVVRARSALASTSQIGTRLAVDLLAHFEIPTGPDSSEPLRGFINLLEIDLHSLLFESSEPLEVGDVMTVRFFLPRPIEKSPGTSPPGATASGRHQISFDSAIGSCVDEPKLLYRANVRRIGEQDREVLQEFMARSNEAAS